MRKCVANLLFIFALASCSNTTDMETGEIRTLQLLKNVFDKPKGSGVFADARNLLSREQIDAAKTPVLFVELPSGQNGTLTLYPGQGVGETWLGADGATITMDQGILKASRGMGDDLMGSNSSMPRWSQLKQKTKPYKRELVYITGNNKLFARNFDCKLRREEKKEVVKIWKVEFRVTKFEETCNHKSLEIKNTYYLDHQDIVRKSFQYHGNKIGYIITERLER